MVKPTKVTEESKYLPQWFRALAKHTGKKKTNKDKKSIFDTINKINNIYLMIKKNSFPELKTGVMSPDKL